MRTVLGRLRKRFGALLPPRRSDPLEELILTVLSQHTSDLNAARSFAALRSAFPSWDAVVAAPTGNVADAIRSGGLAETKAPRIQAILGEIHRRRGAYDLSDLRDLTDDEARSELMSLPGVGPKTAAVVLSFALDRDAMPVDTHVHRVTRRLGWIAPNASAERADRILHELIPAGMRTELHVALIRFGREICRAPVPRCRICPLNDICPTAPRYLGDEPSARRRLRRR
jgi:endonuclease-3